MGAASTLTDFVSWAKTKYVAKHYLLVIWNHGQGYRFEIARRQPLPMVKPLGRLSTAVISSDYVEPFELSDRQRQTVGGFKSVSFDDEDLNTFSITETSKILLARYLKDQKLDVIGFDACLMSMIEAEYAFRSIAKVMVGSEELEPGAGWDYSILLKSLTANPQQIDEMAMGRLIVESYKEAYDGKPLKTTMSATDLSKIESFAATLDALAKSLKTT